MQKNEKGQLVCDWYEFRDCCAVVADSIIAKNQSYSQIIAIVRGGFYLADYLSRKLDLPLSAIVAKSYFNNQRKPLSVGNLSYIIKPTGKILLVDDLVDTGTTLMMIKQQLIDNFSVEIDTAVVWYKSNSQFTPDYYFSQSPSNVWIVQPFSL